MVFRYAQGVTTINGVVLAPESHLEENYERLGRHLLLTKEQARAKMAPEHRQELMSSIVATTYKEPPTSLANPPDPIGSVALLANLDVHERQRVVHTSGAYVDTWLTQVAKVVDDIAWLDGQLTDPRWADHPGRAQAVQQRDVLFASAKDIAESIAWSEAWADRCWQSLTPAERLPVNHMWLTSEHDRRLVMRAWRDQAHFGITWPRGARVDARWFMDLPDRLYMDLMPLWQDGPTWLGEPVEIDTTADEAEMDALVKSIRARLH